VAGFDLLYSLQDIEFDKKLGLHSIPSKFGVKKTMLFSKIMHIITIIFWTLFVIKSSLGIFGYVALISSAVMLTYEHIIVNRDFSKIDQAFFTINGYLGILFFVVLFVAMLILMPLAISFGTEIDWGMIITSSLGLFLLLASFAAAGIFLSSLTSQPVIAAVSSFGLLMFLVVLYLSGGSQSNSSELFIYLSHFSHFETFVRGVIDTSDITYYCLFIVGFLVLAVRKLDNDRLLG
jgi:hypothetical protein